jgi:predicted transcriptional regulator
MVYLRQTGAAAMKISNRSKIAATQQAEYQAWYDEQVRLGIEDIESGRIVSDKELRWYFEERFKQNAGRQQKQAG